MNQSEVSHNFKGNYWIDMQPSQAWWKYQGLSIYVVTKVEEGKSHGVKGQMYIFSIIMCQKLFLNGWADFFKLDMKLQHDLNLCDADS